MGFRGHFRHEVLSHPRWRKGFSVRKFLRRHIEMTVIDHLEKNTELYCSFWKDSHLLFQSDSTLYHFKRIEGAVAPFEETVIYHFEEIIICHIEKRVLGCDIRLWTEVSTWLHLRFWKNHHLRLTVRILLHSRGQIYDGQSYLCDATPCVGVSTNPALNDSRTAGIFILQCGD